MPASAGPPRSFLAPVGLQPISLDRPPSRDVCEVRADGRPLLAGETWLKTPGRAPQAAFTMFEFWDQISDSVPYKGAEFGLEVVDDVAGDLLQIADNVNKRFGILAADHAAGRAPGMALRTLFLTQLNGDVYRAATALQIPMTKSRITEPAREATEALFRAWSPHSAERLLAPVGSLETQARVVRGVRPFIQLTQDRAVTLRRVAAQVGAVTKFVAILPISAAALDLMVATNEDEAKAAFKRLARAGGELGASAAMGAAGGFAVTLAISLSPVALGFYSVVALRVGIGAVGFYVEKRATEVFVERLQLGDAEPH